MTVAAKRPPEPQTERDPLPTANNQPQVAGAAFLLLPLAAVALHLLCAQNYGYFRDELYYLSCSARLDWGYVDHPPLSVALLKLVTTVFGDSLLAVRAPVALASGLTVFLVMATAARLGAGKVGVLIAGLCVLLSGMYLVIFSFYTMNALDILIWALIAWQWVGLSQRPTFLQWTMIGLTLGLGFLNKASILMLIASLLLGVITSPHLRQQLKKPGIWVAALVAGTLAAPHLAWQFAHDWPTKEFASNALREKMLPLAPWEFLVQQAVVMNLFAVPVIVAGVVYGLRSGWSKWLSMSLVFLVVLVVLLLNGRSRINYLAPAYVFVIPLGAVAVERWLASRRLSPAWAIAPICALAPLYLSLGLPWLPPSAMTAIIQASPVQPPPEEAGEKSPMQGWADMFGWPELARDVKGALAELPDRRAAAVVTKNYGEAAALEHYGVSRVLCGQNNFWIWGPQDWDGSVAIFVNEWPDEVKEMFVSFQKVGQVDAPNAVPEQDGSPIWVARGLKVPVSEFWQKIRRFV